MEKYYPNKNRFPQGYNKPAENSDNKIYWILGAIIFIALLVLVYLLISVVNPEKISSDSDKNANGELNNSQFSQSLISCKTWNCFIDASEKCEKANFTFTQSLDLFGANFTSTMYYELKGLKNEKCIFYMRIEEQHMNYTQEAIQQMLDNGGTYEEIKQTEQEINQQSDLLEGKDGQCNIDTDDVVIMLTKAEQGTSSTDDPYFNDCEGSYFSLGL